MTSAVSLRRAVAADALFVWTVNNDPSVRAQSISTAEIPWEGHETWFSAKLRDPKAMLWLAVSAGEPVGVVRFDVGDTEATISVAVAPSARGRGFGKRMIALATAGLRESHPSARAVALVRPDNAASVRAFSAAGYATEGRTVERGIELQRMVNVPPPAGAQSAAFSEDDIRPAELMAEEKRLYEKSLERLLSQRSLFVEVACPACGSERRHTIFAQYDFTFRECDECSSWYVSPRPPPAVLHDYYEHNEYYDFWNTHIFPRSDAVRRQKIFRPRVEQLLGLCRAHRVAMHTLVEVGAGFGTFCEELATTGAFERIVAIEPTPALAARCRRRGIEVIERPVEHAVIEDRVDVVASFEVIEHLFDPASFLRRCAELLNPGGLLVVTCPNVRGFDIEVLQSKSPAVDPEHLNYFHPASLSALLERTGLRVLESTTPGRLDAEIVRNRVLAGEAELTDRFLRRVLLDEWERLGAPFQDFLRSAGLSSNMWVVATKPRA